MRRMFSEKQIQELIKNTPKSITTLVDSQSHNRFVEGEGDLKTIAGITFTYNKWSLSGTHFMLVLAGSIANGTAITTADIFAESSSAPFLNLLFIFCDFLVRMCCFPAFILLIFPVPVALKRLAAALFVFNFGIFLSSSKLVCYYLRQMTG